MDEVRLQKPLPRALQDLLDQIGQANARRGQGFEYTPIGIRENLDLTTRRFVTQVPVIAWTHDTLVSNGDGAGFAVPVRIYHPCPDDAPPVLVFAHGGGHMAGSVSVYDPIARKLAEASGWLVVSIDYRLAPECPYPLGLTDLETVVRGVLPMLDKLGIRHRRRLAVAGDSGGAAITASAVHRLAGEPGIDIDCQVLIYPSLDYTLSCRSIDTLAEGYLLERERIAWLFDQYFQNAEDRRAVSPLFMPLPDGFPRTLVITAGYCPLRDEGFAYVERLAHAGVAVGHRHRPDMIHAFLNLEDLVPEVCAQCYDDIGRFLNAT